MVLRASEPVKSGQQYSTGRIAQSNVQGVNPDYQRHAKGASETDAVVGALARAGGKLAEKAFDKSLEEKYLEGVQAAQTGKSEEELDQNPITSDWAKAGHRDTLGRIALADQQAKLATDMPTLAKGTPEQFKDYMAQQRTPLVNQLNGMSRQQRSATFGQMALDEAAATKRYTVARNAYILQQEQGSIQASLTARRMNMDAAKTDLSLYSQEVDGFVSTVYKDIMQNPKLPDATKTDMLRQAAEYAASGDNVMVYEKLKNTKFQFPDGTTSTMMQKLSFEDQIKIDKAQRSAMDRVKVVRAGEFEQKIAGWTADWADPNTGVTQTYEEVLGELKRAEVAGILSPGKTESVLTNWHKGQARNGYNSTLAQAYSAGDTATMAALGADQEKSLKSYMQSIKTLPVQAQVTNLMAIGNNAGMETAMSKAGELMKPAIAQLGYGDEIDPNNAEIVKQVAGALTIAEKNNPGSYSKFMQGMSQEQQDMFVYMSEAQKNGMSDPITVTKWARAQQLADKQTGGLRQQRISDNSKEDSAAVSEIEPRQLLGTISSKFSFFQNALNKDKLRTGRSWFENEDRVAEVLAGGQMAYAEELAMVSKTSPFMSADGRKSKALANLGARTIDTESGPLMMPRGQSVQSYFGTPPYADAKYVGAALDDLVKPQEGNRIAWSTTADNQLLYREFNKDGRIVKSATMNPREVAPKVQENLQRDADKAAAEYGPGTTMKVGNNRVNFNGTNTAGMPADQVLRLRQDIVKSEGISMQSYADSGGKSFGVGIHQTNNYYQRPPANGIYAQTQIDESFKKASDDAVNSAFKTMQTIGVTGESYLRLFGELAYQSPKSARDPDLLAYISIGDKQGAINALKETPAYKNSPPDRRAGYLAKLNKAM